MTLSMTEENKFFFRLISPNLQDLEDQFKNFGLLPDDFITILHRRLKGKVPRQTIKDTLDVIWLLQHQVQMATRIKDIGED